MSLAAFQTIVAEVMSTPLITAPPDESTRNAMETMTQCRCRHLVVMDDGEMVGIVSIGDRCMFGRGTGIVGHLSIEIGDDADLPDGSAAISSAMPDAGSVSSTIGAPAWNAAHWPST